MLATYSVAYLYRIILGEVILGLPAADATAFKLTASIGFNFDRERILRIAFAAFGKRNAEVAHLSDRLGVDDGVGHLREKFFHLGARLEIELRTGEFHPVLFLDLRTGLNAKHRIVRAGIGGVDVVDIVRGDDFEIELLCELKETVNDFYLFGNSVVLDFDEKVFAAKYFDKPSAGATGVFPAIMKQVLRNKRSEAAGETDQAVRVRREGFQVGPRFIIKSFEMRV